MHLNSIRAPWIDLENKFGNDDICKNKIKRCFMRFLEKIQNWSYFNAFFMFHIMKKTGKTPKDKLRIYANFL